ncbi:hypothetical protein B0H10DRAFT_891660 [Mycena sp. CBHHK59/15]|nr:hypothetical protein B0H10DRAFT_891660 [Mycena sp. CBHHK59/15]
MARSACVGRYIRCETVHEEAKWQERCPSLPPCTAMLEPLGSDIWWHGMDCLRCARGERCAVAQCMHSSGPASHGERLRSRHGAHKHPTVGMRGICADAVGVGVWGSACGEPGKYTVYTTADVSLYSNVLADEVLGLYAQQAWS